MTKTLLCTFIVLAAASQAVLGHDAFPLAEKSLANTLLKSTASMNDSPQRNIGCFSTYLPQINEATNTYETEYTNCLDVAANATAAIEAEVATDRASVQAGADGVCTLFNECSQKNTSFGFFECYNDAAGQAISAAYEIQTVSKTRMQFISLKYQTISYDQKTCTDTCSDAYIQETASLYAALEACLAGDNVSTVTSTPSTSTSSDFTTEEITTLATDAPTTETTQTTQTTTEGSIPTPPNSK